MQTQLPKMLDPWKLAAASGRLQGTLPLKAMKRLISSLETCAGDAQLALKAGVDAQGVAFLSGHVEAEVEIVCQRCMSVFPLSLRTDFRLGLVHSESEARVLPKHYEPLLVPERGLELSELIEDELILALPMIASHQDERLCEIKGERSANNIPQDSDSGDDRGPFAILSNLLKKSDNQEF